MPTKPNVNTPGIEFNALHQGQHVTLCCLSAHLRDGVPNDKLMVRDSLWRTRLVPKAEVRIISQQ